MGEFVVDRRVYFNEYDLSAKHSEVTINYGADTKEINQYTFASKKRIPGLKNIELTGSGFWQSDVGSAMYPNISTSNTIVSVCGDNGAEGDTVFFSRYTQGEYALGEAIGEVHAFNYAAMSQGDPLIRGSVLVTGSKTSTGASTAQQIGAVTAAQKGYAAIHVFSASGTTPTLDVVVRSDDNAGMTSATNRITFAQTDVATSEYLTVDGAITDDYWDISYTIGGSDTPTFLFVVVFGII